MGVVYEAEQIHIQRRVAIKILRSDLAADVSAVERLQREAQLTSDLGHPNLVQCRDFGHARDGRVYLALEWLEGETLEARLDRDGVDAATAVEISIQTCSGLAEAHERAVIHRDLKPANLFLTTDRDGKLRVKILDFGIAKLAQQQVALTATGVVIGTPNYMSPEQALGDTVDARADIYSLGVILYEMVTGAVPFKGDSALAVLHQHSVRMPVAPSQTAPEREVPPALESVVMRCLAKRPADRYATALTLRDALEAARARHRWPNRSRRPPHCRHRSRMWRSAIQALTALAGFGHSSRPRSPSSACSSPSCWSLGGPRDPRRLRDPDFHATRALPSPRTMNMRPTRRRSTPRSPPLRSIPPLTVRKSRPSRSFAAPRSLRVRRSSPRRHNTIRRSRSARTSRRAIRASPRSSPVERSMAVSR